MSAEEKEIVELQSRIAFQEDAVNSLNEIVARQDTEIRTLQQQLAALYKKVDDLRYEIEQDSNSPEPPPPHY